MFYGCFRRSAEWCNLPNRRREHQRFLTWATDTTHIHYKVLTLNLSLLYNPCKPPLCRFPGTFAIKQHNIGAVFFQSVVSTFLTELWMGKRMRGGKIESSFLCERVNFAGSFWLGVPRQLGNNVIHHQTVNEGIHRMAKRPDFGSFNQRILTIGKAELIYYSYYSSLIKTCITCPMWWFQDISRVWLIWWRLQKAVRSSSTETWSPQRMWAFKDGWTISATTSVESHSGVR